MVQQVPFQQITASRKRPPEVSLNAISAKRAHKLQLVDDTAECSMPVQSESSTNNNKGKYSLSMFSIFLYLFFIMLDVS